MNQVSSTWGALVILFWGSSQRMDFVIIKSNDVILKSKFPFSWDYYDNQGLSHDFLSKLSVSIACGMSPSQSYSGKLSPPMNNPAMKVYLKVLI